MRMAGGKTVAVRPSRSCTKVLLHDSSIMSRLSRNIIAGKGRLLFFGRRSWCTFNASPRHTSITARVGTDTGLPYPTYLTSTPCRTTSYTAGIKTRRQCARCFPAKVTVGRRPTQTSGLRQRLVHPPFLLLTQDVAAKARAGRSNVKGRRQCCASSAEHSEWSRAEHDTSLQSYYGILKTFLSCTSSRRSSLVTCRQCAMQKYKAGEGQARQQAPQGGETSVLWIGRLRATFSLVVGLFDYP